MSKTASNDRLPLGRGPKHIKFNVFLIFGSRDNDTHIFDPTSGGIYTLHMSATQSRKKIFKIQMTTD